MIDDTLVIGGEEIKARKASSRMTVDVRVNGRGPYRFLVDSGADTSVVGQALAAELQLPQAGSAVLHSITGSALVGRVQVAELSVGPSSFHDLELPALREEDLGGAGMLGIDALAQQRLMLDFENRIIKAEDARQKARYVDGEIVVTARRRRGQLILTQVRAAGLPLEAVIDTGSEISIGNLALRDRLMHRRRGEIETVTATGVTGQSIEMQIAIIRELQVGSITLYDVPVAFADVTPFQLFGMSQRPAMLLGTDLLEAFRRVSLDFRDRKVRFQLRKCGISGVTIGSSASALATRISSGGVTDACRR